MGIGTSRDVPPKKRSYKRSTALVETEVRRSPRLKSSHMGFKSGVCTDRKCLACGTKPPILKKEAIRKLAVDFCSLDKTEVCDDVLQTKRKKTHPVARARITPQDPAPSQLVVHEEPRPDNEVQESPRGEEE